ncbi:unnamed protein product [Jaminaea pallidilutea]
MNSRPPKIFVTVGSTKFAPLIAYLLSNSFLASLPPETKLTIQYGKSDLGSILTNDDDNALTGAVAGGSTSSSDDTAFKVDAGSAFVPQAGLRATKEHGLSWKASQIDKMDPGKTGTIEGWQLIDKAEGQDQTAVQSTQTEARRRRGAKAAPSRGDKGAYDADEGSGDEEQSSRATPKGSDAARPGQATFSAFPSSLQFSTPAPQHILLTLVDFVQDLRPHLLEADIVIAHAGSGTILETLRLPNPPRLIIVPNTSLMDNHQAELAEAIDRGGWARMAMLSSETEHKVQLVTVLKETVEALNMSASQADLSMPRTFPAPQPERFRLLVDEAMGLD